MKGSKISLHVIHLHLDFLRPEPAMSSCFLAGSETGVTASSAHCMSRLSTRGRLSWLYSDRGRGGLRDCWYSFGLGLGLSILPFCLPSSCRLDCLPSTTSGRRCSIESRSRHRCSCSSSLTLCWCCCLLCKLAKLALALRAVS